MSNLSVIEQIGLRLEKLKSLREKAMIEADRINKEINVFVEEKTKYYADLFLKEKGFGIGDVVEIEQEYQMFRGVILSYESFMGIHENNSDDDKYGGLSGFKIQLLRKDGHVSNKKQYIWFCYMKSVKLVKKNA